MKNSIRRHSLLAGIVLLFTGMVILFSQVAMTHHTETAARPNIIYIMADDMGYSDIGCYGGEINTPHLDKLAAEGIKLRSFYNNVRCCPTRASLLTGQYPHTVGMGHMVSKFNAPVQPGPYQGFLDAQYPTIAEALKQAGYRTYMAGKWHVGERREHWPMKRGFDHYFGLISGASGYYGIIPAEKDTRFIVRDDAEFKTPPDGFYMTDAFTDYAIGYLNEHRDQQPQDPFFLYLAYTAPHFPLHAYESDISRYEAVYQQGWDSIRSKRYEKMKALGLLDERYPLTARPEDIPAWETVTDKEIWARKMAVYAAMIDRMDRNIGRLLETLQNNGQLENTLIVFLSDNGACAENTDRRKLNDPASRIGAPGSYLTYDTPWANVSNTPFRKYKRFLHEGGMITPCILHWPARIASQAGYSDGIGHVIDLLPTALELAGAAPAPPLPGKSLSYLWNGGQPVARAYRWEHEGNKAIREGNWKLVRDEEDAGWALYDLQTDPCEIRDLADAFPKRVAELQTAYTAWMVENGVRETRK